MTSDGDVRVIPHPNIEDLELVVLVFVRSRLDLFALFRLLSMRKLETFF